MADMATTNLLMGFSPPRARLGLGEIIDGHGNVLLDLETDVGPSPMSAMGQKQTLDRAYGMSALLPRTDTHSARHQCLVNRSNHADLGQGACQSKASAARSNRAGSSFSGLL